MSGICQCRIFCTFHYRLSITLHKPYPLRRSQLMHLQDQAHVTRQPDISVILPIEPGWGLHSYPFPFSMNVSAIRIFLLAASSSWFRLLAFMISSLTYILRPLDALAAARIHGLRTLSRICPGLLYWFLLPLKEASSLCRFTPSILLAMIITATIGWLFLHTRWNCDSDAGRRVFMEPMTAIRVVSSFWAFGFPAVVLA